MVGRTYYRQLSRADYQQRSPLSGVPHFGQVRVEQGVPRI